MRVTQGTFSFLPDLTDAEIRAQIEYVLAQGWAASVEYTDDPHPRNSYWEMWGNPMFDIKDAAGVMLEVNACRKAHSNLYVRVNAFDSTHGFESMRLSFIVNRPKREPGFRLHRQEIDGRAIRYTISSYATDLPEGERYSNEPPAGTLMDVNETSAGAGAKDAGGGASATEASAGPVPTEVDLKALLSGSGVNEVLDELDRELIGLKPVKARIRDIAALLLVERARKQLGLAAGSPSLHMSFTGNPGTGKTTVALRMAQILHRLGYVRKGHLVAVTRDDLVGQYIGHTAPKTKEILKKAMGGVLFIDEAYYLYRPENERDYGQEAIEILLQVMENQRDDLVVIVAGYRDRMDTFFRSNPGLSSRIAHHLDFPDYDAAELEAIADNMLLEMQYRLSDSGRAALRDYIPLRMHQPHFANARSIRNALDRARLRQASRLFAGSAGALGREALMTIEADDLRASRVFEQASGDIQTEFSP